MSYELQQIDTNCNDCGYLKRLFGDEGKAARSVFYGRCLKKDERVTFMPATCCPENAGCFKHRKDVLQSKGPTIDGRP
jgi:hypothetical protein